MNLTEIKSIKIQGNNGLGLQFRVDNATFKETVLSDDIPVNIYVATKASVPLWGMII